MYRLRLSSDSGDSPTDAGASSLLRGERHALAQLVAGEPLEQVLEQLVRAVEEAAPGMQSQIMLVTPDGAQLAHGAAHGLPQELRVAMRPCPIGPTGLCPAVAAFLHEVVIATDLASDIRCANQAQTALSHGFKACWCVPIHGANRKVEGVFVNWFREPRPPTQRERDVVEFVRNTAALAIERHETDRSLRESEDHYRHAVNLNPQVAWTSRIDGQLDYVGKRWVDWTGTSGLGTSWVEAIHPDDLQRTLETWNQSFNSGQAYDIEHRVKLVDGHYHWMRSRALPRLDDEGKIVKWYGATEDIDERKRTEQALREREAELSALNDSLGSEVLARTHELTELTRHLQVAQEEERSRVARELHDELGALFTAAKFDVARLKSRLGPLSPELAQRFAHFIEMLDKGIDLKRRIIEDLRPSALSSLGLVAALEILASEHMRAYGTEVRCQLSHLKLKPAAELTIYRLVQEALTNVATYAHATQVTVILVQEGDADVIVSVTDNGVGFDASTNRISMHGLMGMHYRVEAQGGALYVNSGPTEGTCISARLPLG